MRAIIKWRLESLSVSQNPASSKVGGAELKLLFALLKNAFLIGSWSYCVLVNCENHIFNESQFKKCQLSEMELYTNSILFPISIFIWGQMAYRIYGHIPRCWHIMGPSLSRSIPSPHCLSWKDCNKCEHATNFKRMNNQCIKVLPFKMANIKPPIFVLKKKIYLLAGFPRNTSQQFETDNEVFVLVC